MAEYRACARASRRVLGSFAAVSPLIRDEHPAYANLAHQYGVMDMQFATSESAEEQTIKQEFQSFVTAPLLPRGTNTLKFWEVCGYQSDRARTLFIYLVYSV